MQTTGSPKSEPHGDGLERPRFRQDLVAEQIDEAGARFIDVMDPDSGSLFRFYEVEYSIACAMDGERDVPGIVRWAQEELGLKASTTEVTTVIATLGSLGYLERPGAAAEAAPADDELAAGIVVGKRQDTEVDGTGVELGLSNMAAAATSHEPMPEAPDYGLGAPGSTVTSRSPSMPVEDIKLGEAGAQALASEADDAIPQTGDMSLDLSDHLAIKPDDVKEAVRASRVMATPELPKDLLEALEEPTVHKPAAAEAKPAKPEVKPEAKKPEVKKPSTQPMATVAPAKPVEIKPTSQRIEAKPSDTKPSKPAVELPRPVPVAADQSRPTAPKSGVSTMTIVLFLLLVATAAGFFAWKYLLNNPEETEDTQDVPSKKPRMKPPVKPAEPPPISGQLKLETPTPVDLSSLTAGAVESVEANGKMVKADDVVARLAGAKQLETDIAAIQKDVDRVKPELDKANADLAAATAGANKDALAKAQAVVKDRQTSLDDKQAKMTAKTAELAKFVVKATTDGQLTITAKVGQHVAASESIAKLAPTPLLVVVLKAPALATGSTVTLAVKNSDKKLTCTVASVDGDSAKVTCPTEATLADPTDVTLVK